MTERVIIIRYAEIHLKGKNRGFFERLFTVNLERCLKGLRHELRRLSGRYLVEKFDGDKIEEIEERIASVFGVHSYSVGLKTEAELDSIFECALSVCPEDGTFKVETHRGNKRFPCTSMEVNAEIGARLLNARPRLKVDVHSPASYVYIDIRENQTALVFGEFKKGRGGMPVGASGKGLLLISGGIDSPVAGYMMAKRGLELIAVHFASPPYTSDRAQQKVISLGEKLLPYIGRLRLFIVPFTELQEQLRDRCPEEYFTLLMRRAMMRIAEAIALREGCQGLITGESVGQVASQTIQALGVTDSVTSLPVLRPAIGMDKSEIVAIARKIDTFETSILPYEDCCTVFTPRHPRTRPKGDEVARVEAEAGIPPEALREAAEAAELPD